VQIKHPESGRRTAKVDGNRLVVLRGYESAYALARAATAPGASIAERVANSLGDESLDYEEVYSGRSPWKLLPPFDHPEDEARCLVSGTGLTHIVSASARNSMHATQAETAPKTDSIRIYEWGVEGGRPRPGSVGVQPEWFYKGDGACMRAHGQPLEIPTYAKDGGEESEVASAYLIADDGRPWRVGFMIGNEFSDHLTERENYLYLAHSKLRQCGVGPELVVDLKFDDIRGRATVKRNGGSVWSRELATGERNMCHSLANLEHHHFKYAVHRRPGDVHIHFLGAGALSFADGVSLEAGDVVEIDIPALGRSLRSIVDDHRGEETLCAVNSLGG